MAFFKLYEHKKGWEFYINDRKVKNLLSHFFQKAIEIQVEVFILRLVF